MSSGNRASDPWHGLMIAMRDVLRYILAYDPPGEAVGGEVEVEVAQAKGAADEDVA